jgi:ABC-type nitrate/sulfonate/bicarbonate transport system ATPase subunit
MLMQSDLVRTARPGAESADRSGVGILTSRLGRSTHSLASQCSDWWNAFERASDSAIIVTHDVAEAITLADRVLMIDQGEIALDLRIDLPRPRKRGSPDVAAIEGQILRALLRNAPDGEDG